MPLFLAIAINKLRIVKSQAVKQADNVVRAVQPKFGLWVLSGAP